MIQIIQGIVVSYFVIASFFALYYEWQFAVENGFIVWLLFGWMIPVFKAIIWPIILF
jgi:hypothetical protein